MLRTAWIPFIITCLIYTVIGFHLSTGSTDMDFREIFRQEFRISWIALLPAVSIMLLSFLHVNVKLTMLVSILTAIPVSIWLQGTGITDLLYFAGFGYKAKNAGLGAMINGGGIISMIKVAAIVCLSSSYSGIFQKTGLLSSIQEKIQSASSHITAYGAILVTAVLTAMLSCNQTLTIMLTHQLCHDLKKEKENFAIDLENSAVVIPALIPWSVAGAVPLASISAPPVTIIAACFLYLLPIWQLFISLRKGSRF
jgi:NhaC family Na+:H+ antiporter